MEARVELRLSGLRAHALSLHRRDREDGRDRYRLEGGRRGLVSGGGESVCQRGGQTVLRSQIKARGRNQEHENVTEVPDVQSPAWESKTGEAT